METIYLRLKPVIYHLVETAGIGIEHHDRHRDTLLTQHHALVGKCHGEVTNAQTLHQLRHLDIARAVTMRLDHRNEAVIHRQELTEVAHIVGHSVEVYLQHRSVTLALKVVADTLEVVSAVALQKDCATLDILVLESLHQSLGSRIKLATRSELVGIGRNPLTHTYKLLHARLLHQFRHARIQLLVAHSALQDIRHNRHRVSTQRHAAQRIKRQSKGVYI